jgi:hypothetical protein
VLQYFVSDTAKDFYTTRRKSITSHKPMTAEELLAEMKQHIVPSTHMNQYWKQWDKISQIKNGKAIRISSVSIEIEKISQRLGDGIGPQVKIQKFLDSMHPELRLRVEPSIDRTKPMDWKAIVAQAEKEDDALYQAGKYGRESGKYNSTSAIQTWPPKNSNKKPGQQHQGQNKRYPRRTGDEKKYQERRKKGLCYFCGKPGHMI